MELPATARPTPTDWPALIVAALEDPLFTLDRTWRFTYLNPQALNILSRPQEALLGKVIWDVFPGSAEDRLGQSCRQAIADGLPQRLEDTFLGNQAGYEIRVRPIPEGLIVMFQAITGGKLRVQEQLRLLESAVHHTTEAVLITTADLDAPGPQIIFVNPAFCAMTGYEPHEVIGQNPRMFQGQATDPAVLEQLRMLLSEGQPFHGEIINYRKDGTPYYLEWTTAPLRDRDGVITHFVALQRDITQRKQTQLNLQYSESRFRRMVDRLQNLYDIGQAILSATSLEMIAQRAVRHIVELIPCSCASIVLLDLETEALRTLASQRQEDPKAEPADSSLAESISNHVYLNVPIMVGQRMIGNLKLESLGDEVFTAEHTDIAREVANVLAVAIEHTQLFQQLQASRDRLAALSRRLIDVQEDERRHLARELHDEIGQSLTAIRINLDNLEGTIETPSARGYVQDITAVVQNVMHQVRTLSVDLRPSMLDDLGLISTLRWFLDRQAQRSGLQIQFLPQDRSLAIEASIATTCFRIVQESLTNIVRHANASSVTVALTWQNGQLALQICDDGCGFDPQLVLTSASNTGFGLLGMQERAALVGGMCTISAAPGHGTDVRALFPLTSSTLERRKSNR
jgi:PAS domain S-box-containing protein